MSWVWNHKSSSQSHSRAEPDWNAPPSDPRAARLAYLYAWERRCRGYAIAPYPVPPEPPFVPYAPDDPASFPRLEQTPPLPWTAAISLRHLPLRLSPEQRVTPAVTAAFLAALHGLQAPLAFEIVAGADAIHFQLTTSAPDAASVLAAAAMHWPDTEWPKPKNNAGTTPSFEGALHLDALRHELSSSQTDPSPKDSSFPWSLSGRHAFVVEFGLLYFAYLPLRVFDSFAVDPLAGVIAGLGQLPEGEIAGLQLLFAPVHRHWNRALLQVAGEFDEEPMESGRRGPRSPFESAAVRAARAKLAHPLYAAVLRVFAFSRRSGATAFAHCKRIGGALGAFTQSEGNGLIALSNNDPHSTHPHSVYPDEVHAEDVLLRRSHRPGFLLSLPEMAGLAHPPAKTLVHPKLVRFDPHAQGLPEHLLHAPGITLGRHPYRQEAQPLVWPDAYRNRHAYLLGATRMGKSTLLLNMIVQDMQAGRGLCVIDPHGDLALDVLARIPEERSGDVLYLDLSDREYPLALGLLQAGSEHERRLLCSDLLSVLKRLFASSWGDRLEHILRHAIVTLLAAGENSSTSYTLRDIRPLLSNKAFRERVVASLADHDLQAFWRGEFGTYSSSTFGPIYNKLGLLLSSPLVRNIVAGRESKLDFADVIRQKQILLVNLAGSQIGNDQAHFLGALLVSKLQIAAMGSLRLGITERTPFTLYVDEFQNFVVSSFETILSEAGKAGLSLVMANQFLEQLSSQLQTAILSNAGTLCSFRVSSDSGRLLEKEFAGRFTAKELVSLNRGEAVARVGSAGDSFWIETMPPPPLPPASLAQSIRERSRIRICRPRAEVEAELVEAAACQAALLADEEEREKQAEAENKQAVLRQKEAETEQRRLEKQAEAERKAAEWEARKRTVESKSRIGSKVSKEAEARVKTRAPAVMPQSVASPDAMGSAAIPPIQPSDDMPPQAVSGPENRETERPDEPREPEYFGVLDE
jgi:hypothetical protein